MSNCYVNDFSTTVRTYYKELKKYQPLSKEEERKLILQAKNNNLSARNKVLTSNLKFVFDVAKKYKGCGVSFDDLIAEGNVGLTKALDKFDTKHDVKFISYAVWWIRQSMQERIKNQAMHNAMEVSEEEELNRPVHKSSDELLKDNEDEYITKRETVLSNEKDEEKRIKHTMQCKVIKSLLDKLDKRGQYIISSYYGLDGDEMTLDEIGTVMHLSKERVRQIKEKSLRILKSEMLMQENVNSLL